MVFSDFLYGYTSASLYSRYSLCLHSTNFFLFFERSWVLHKKIITFAQKSMLCRPKNISHRNYVAHQYDVVHKKVILWQQKDLCDTQYL